MQGHFHIETSLSVSKVAPMGQVLRAFVVLDVIQFCDFDNFMVIKLCGLNAQRTILKIPISSRITRVKMFRKLLNFLFSSWPV